MTWGSGKGVGSCGFMGTELHFEKVKFLEMVVVMADPGRHT